VATATDTLPHAPEQPTTKAKPWLSLSPPVSDGGANVSLFRICDDMDVDLKLARACRLAAWGLSEEGRDEDATALYVLIGHLVDRLEEQHGHAGTLREAEQPAGRA
jgi:hypothetical protein